MSDTVRIEMTGDFGGRMIAAVKRRSQPEALDPKMATLAGKHFGLLKRATPKKWTGDTRNQWQLQRNGPADYSITSDSRVMKYLEFGTQDHGPTHAKALFIPLTKKAWLAYTSNLFFSKGNKGTFKVHAYGGYRKGKALKMRVIVLEYGVDYVLAKRVRGIPARHIVRDQRAKVSKDLRLMWKGVFQEAWSEAKVK